MHVDFKLCKERLQALELAACRSCRDLTPSGLAEVLVCSELSPWSNSGGMGRISASLSQQIALRGHRTMRLGMASQSSEVDRNPIVFLHVFAFGSLLRLSATTVLFLHFHWTCVCTPSNFSGQWHQCTRGHHPKTASCTLDRKLGKVFRR